MSQIEQDSASTVEPRRERKVPEFVYPYSAGLIGGALGGAAMVVVAVIYGILSQNLWLPVNLIGATLVRELQGASIEVLSQFNLAALVVGLLMHATLSVGLGFVFSLLLPTMPGPPIVWALTVGPLLWSLASLVTLPAINQTMAASVDVPSFFVAHIAYGLVLGWWVARVPKIPA